MQVVINYAPGDLTLSNAAHERLIQFGIPCLAPSQMAEREPEEFVIYDMSLDPDYTLSENPDDAEHSIQWRHAAFRYDCYALQFGINRSNPFLVRVVEEMGIRAGAPGQRPVLVDVPDNVHATLTRDGAGWEIIAWPTLTAK